MMLGSLIVQGAGNDWRHDGSGTNGKGRIDVVGISTNRTERSPDFVLDEGSLSAPKFLQLISLSLVFDVDVAIAIDVKKCYIRLFFAGNVHLKAKPRREDCYQREL
jgi:hypothetical protein